MAWTAADINRLAQGGNNQKKWTANDIAALAKGTNSQRADTKEQTAKKTDPDITRAKALQQYTERHISDMGLWMRGTSPLRRCAPPPPEWEPLACQASFRWTLEALRGVKWRALLQRAAAAAGRRSLRASFAKDSVPDEFDRINQWMDTGDNKNLADAVRRVDNTHGAYTDADLIQKGGWTQEQIDEARKMNAALDAIPAWKRYARRAANAIGGIGDTVAAAPVLGAEYGVQAGKNIDATLKNWKQVEQEVKGDEHAQNLFDLLTDVDMDYNPTWPESRNRELISMGYNPRRSGRCASGWPGWK